MAWSTLGACYGYGPPLYGYGCGYAPPPPPFRLVSCPLDWARCLARAGGSARGSSLTAAALKPLLHRREVRKGGGVRRGDSGGARVARGGK
jgi:hypothetical protein